jgi:hypothetical protein
MAIKILKLTSIEDIICDYEEVDGKCIMEKPAKLIMVPTEGGGMGIGIMPWVPFSDDEKFEIKKECIMLEPMEPSKSIRNEYSIRFGSGFVDTTPDASNLIF